MQEVFETKDVTKEKNVVIGISGAGQDVTKTLLLPLRCPILAVEPADKGLPIGTIRDVEEDGLEVVNHVHRSVARPTVHSCSINTTWFPSGLPKSGQGFENRADVCRAGAGEAPGNGIGRGGFARFA